MIERPSEPDGASVHPRGELVFQQQAQPIESTQRQVSMCPRGDAVGAASERMPELLKATRRAFGSWRQCREEAAEQALHDTDRLSGTGKEKRAKCLHT